MPPPTLLALDGNSLVHRSFHASAASDTRFADGRPCWAVRGLLLQLMAAVDRLRPELVVVGFDDPSDSQRRGRWPQYKAQRADKLDTLVEQLAAAAAALADLGVHVVVPAGLEADDVLASAAAFGAAHGLQTVIATSDRDAFALIDDTTRVLRIINGGVDASPLMTADRLEVLLGVRPQQYRDFAALRGDPSDNLPGVRGIGPRSAARLLQRFGGAGAAFDDLETVRAELGAGIAGRLAAPGARDAWELNCQVMTMRADVPLGGDNTGAFGANSRCGRLPLSADAVRSGFRAVGLTWSVRDAVRVLAEIDEAAEPADAAHVAAARVHAQPAPDDRAWPPTGWARPRLPKLAPRAPVPAQLSLFD